MAAEAGVKVGGNAWERRPRSQNSKSTFLQWKRTFPGWKDSFIHGNARSWAAKFQSCPSYPVAFSSHIILLLSGVAGRILLLMKFSSEPFNLYLVKKHRVVLLRYIENINLISTYRIVSYRLRKYRNFRYIGIKFLIYHLAEFSFIYLFILALV